MKPTLSKYYDHDPRHYRFVRATADFAPIEDCGSSAGDAFVLFVAAVIAVILLVWS